MKKNDVDVEEGDDEDTFIGNYFLVFVESYFSINQLKKNAKRKNFPRSELAGFFFGLFKFGYSASLLSYSCFEFFNIF